MVAVSKSDDPERLLAEALRAQAVSTPVTMPPLPAVLTKGDEPPEAAPEQAAEEPEEAVSVEEPAAARATSVWAAWASSCQRSQRASPGLNIPTE